MPTFDSLPKDVRSKIFAELQQQTARKIIAYHIEYAIYYASYRKHIDVIADLNWKFDDLDWLISYPGIRWQLKYSPHTFNKNVNMMTHNSIIININYGDYDTYSAMPPYVGGY